MRRNLAYSNPAMAPNTIENVDGFPQGDWHVSKASGILFVGDAQWAILVRLVDRVDDGEFHLGQTTNLVVQASGTNTCNHIAIESKPAHDIFVVGGGFRASSPRGPHRTELEAGDRR